MDPLQPGLNLRPRLLAAGVTDAELRALRRHGEDALRDYGLQVVRWVWDELDLFDGVFARIRRAFAQA